MPEAEPLQLIDVDFEELLGGLAKRPLGPEPYPFVFLDVSQDARADRIVVVATGFRGGGDAETIGVHAGADTPDFWRDFLSDLRARGLRGVVEVASARSGHLGAALVRELPGVMWHPSLNIDDYARRARRAHVESRPAG